MSNRDYNIILGILVTIACIIAAILVVCRLSRLCKTGCYRPYAGT